MCQGTFLDSGDPAMNKTKIMFTWILLFIMCMNMCVLVEETKNTKVKKETLVYIIKW